MECVIRLNIAQGMVLSALITPILVQKRSVAGLLASVTYPNSAAAPMLIAPRISSRIAIFNAVLKVAIAIFLNFALARVLGALLTRWNTTESLAAVSLVSAICLKCALVIPRHAPLTASSLARLAAATPLVFATLLNSAQVTALNAQAINSMDPNVSAVPSLVFAI